MAALPGGEAVHAFKAVTWGRLPQGAAKRWRSEHKAEPYLSVGSAAARARVLAWLHTSACPSVNEMTLMAPGVWSVCGHLLHCQELHWSQLLNQQGEAESGLALSVATGAQATGWKVRVVAPGQRLWEQPWGAWVGSCLEPVQAVGCSQLKCLYL